MSARARSDAMRVRSASRAETRASNSCQRARSSRIRRKSNTDGRVCSSNAAARSRSKVSGGRLESVIASSTAGSVSSCFAAADENCRLPEKGQDLARRPHVDRDGDPRARDGRSVVGSRRCASRPGRKRRRLGRGRRGAQPATRTTAGATASRRLIRESPPEPARYPRSPRASRRATPPRAARGS